MSFEAVPIEQVREYWDRRPCNIRHSRKPVSSRECSRHGAWVTAVDISERSLTVARQQAEVFGLQQMIRFYQGRGEELRSMVPAEPFDLIYSFGVIHHRSARELVGRGGFRSRRRGWTIFSRIVFGSTLNTATSRPCPFAGCPLRSCGNWKNGWGGISALPL